MGHEADLPVLIAGGGPVGILTALALARRGVAVRVFEAGAAINAAPRASTLHPASLEMLASLGLMEGIAARGLLARTFQFWDRPTSRVVAEFDHAALSDDTAFPFVIQCEQHKLAQMGLDALRAFPHAQFGFLSSVSGLEQRADRVIATVETEQGPSIIEGSYLVGADGGRSTIRKALGIDFEGYTFPERFLVLTTLDDFAAEHGVAYRAYFSDPEQWTNLFKVAGDDGKGRWRAVFPTLPGQPDEEVMNDEAAERRLQKLFPKAGRYEIAHKNIYNVHQRVAARFRDGRVFLAGDAAHVNNPIGGLGLNCGIHDAMYLAEVLGGVLNGEFPHSILDRYDEIRRPMNVEYVQQQTIANKKRLEEKDTATREANFATLKATAANPQSHRAFLMRTSLLESVRKQPAPQP
ncbi:FAD-dependent oxidoreductase [Ancylobacter oerskovii]|uniref:FAD-dependent oxidoreductase n=1 Tax=Ancylobacter oerskovii TaxID=459519 RepID=A0ABW4Z0T2_9HYPH|nr:FAD-dependent monooxygenase [Ancylobacter oerskovii]MBS7542826.1 FAD-dependent monooxygenase [Ancylobacter oerskovii]